VVPTPRLWALIALGVPFAGVSAAAGFGWMALVYNLVLGVVAIATYWMAPSGKGLMLSRRFDPVLSVRVPNRIDLEVVNEGLEPIRARLRDEPPPDFDASRKEFPIQLQPGQGGAFYYTVVPPDRGGDFFRGTYLRIRCPLGLVEREAKLRTEQPVRVYPNVLALREFDLLNQKGRLSHMGVRKSRIRGLGTEFESLRDYAEGDDYRKMDWKASARRGKFVVRQYEQERNQAVIICVDVGRKMLSEVRGVSKLDHTLDACLLLAHSAAAAGDAVGLLVWADTVRRYIPPGRGRAQVGTIIEAIHDLSAEPVESDVAAAFAYLSTRWKRRSLLVGFTDAEDPDQADDLTRAMGPLAKRHIAVIASVADPQLLKAATGPVDSTDDLYLKGSALMFSDLRKGAKSRLAMADVHSVDAEPQDLASALVSFYFDVKDRGLL
jgi:uncharacterized protein (DUF58 family)